MAPERHRYGISSLSLEVLRDVKSPALGHRAGKVQSLDSKGQACPLPTHSQPGHVETSKAFGSLIYTVVPQLCAVGHFLPRFYSETNRASEKPGPLG